MSIAPLTTLQEAAKAFSLSGVVLYPTDTIWGFGCLPNDQLALQKLMKIKQRDPSKGLILLGENLNQFEPYILPISSDEKAHILNVSKRPTTWVVPAAKDINPMISGGRTTVAIRISTSEFVKSLCRLIGPITSTSANLSGQPNLETREDCIKHFASSVDYICEGQCGVNQMPSAIIDLKTGKVLRS